MNTQSINELLDSLKNEFLGTLPERINEIEALLLKLPIDSDVENLLRQVHSLKGSAGTHGFHIVTKVCHQMEDMMRELIDQNEIHSDQAVKHLLEYNDLLNTCYALLNNNDENFSAVDSRLNQINLSSGNQQKKILIVEPSPLYAAMLHSLIEKKGHKVVIVTNGLVALENMLMQDYDVLITALEVPTLNGDAFLSAVRLSQGRNKDINAILVTSKDKSKVELAKLFNHIVKKNMINDVNLLEMINN